MKTPRLYFDDFFGSGDVPTTVGGSQLPIGFTSGNGDIEPNYSAVTDGDISRGYDGVIELGLGAPQEVQRSFISWGDSLAISLASLKHFQSRLNLIFDGPAAANTIFRFGLGSGEATWNNFNTFVGLQYRITGTGVVATHDLVIGNGITTLSFPLPGPLWIGDGTLGFDFTRGITDYRVIGSSDSRGDRVETLFAFDATIVFSQGVVAVQPFMSVDKVFATDAGTIRADSWELQY